MSGSDVKDILEIGGGGAPDREFITKDALMYSDKKVRTYYMVSFYSL